MSSKSCNAFSNKTCDSAMLSACKSLTCSTINFLVVFSLLTVIINLEPSYVLYEYWSKLLGGALYTILSSLTLK